MNGKVANSIEFKGISNKDFQKSFKCIIDFAKCRRYGVICAKTPPSINVMSQEFSRRSIQYMSARGLVHLQRRRTSVKTGPIQTMKGDIAWRYVDTVCSSLYLGNDFLQNVCLSRYHERTGHTLVTCSFRTCAIIEQGWVDMKIVAEARFIFHRKHTQHAVEFNRYTMFWQCFFFYSFLFITKWHCSRYDKMKSKILKSTNHPEVVTSIPLTYIYITIHFHGSVHALVKSGGAITENNPHSVLKTTTSYHMHIFVFTRKQLK